MQTLGRRFTEDDTLPEIGGELVGQDLTGWSIVLKIKRPDDLLVKDATIDTPTSGQFRFPWMAGDLVAGNGQEAVIVITNEDGQVVSSDNFLINVKAKLV